MASRGRWRSRRFGGRAGGGGSRSVGRALILGGGVGRDDADDAQIALAQLGVGDLHLEALIGAVGAAKARWSDTTAAPMLSTLLRLTPWLTPTRHLARDPVGDPLVRAPPPP